MKIETYSDINALLLGKQHGKELDKMHMLNTVKEKTGKVFQCDQGHLWGWMKSKKKKKDAEVSETIQRPQEEE